MKSLWLLICNGDIFSQCLDLRSKLSELSTLVYDNRGLFILPITVFLILTTACCASDHTPFFRRSTSLVNESVSILATANLTYELGLTDFKFVGWEHTLGIGGTIGYAFTGSWGTCVRLSLHKYLYSRWNVYYGLMGGMYGFTTAKALAAKPMYAPFLGLLFQCSRHWGINAEFAPLLLHSFIDGQVVSAVPSFSIGVVQTF